MIKLKDLIKEADSKIYVKKGQPVPKGKTLKTGPRGGQYFMGSAEEKEKFEKKKESNTKLKKILKNKEELERRILLNKDRPDVVKAYQKGIDIINRDLKKLKQDDKQEEPKQKKEKIDLTKKGNWDVFPQTSDNNYEAMQKYTGESAKVNNYLRRGGESNKNSMIQKMDKEFKNAKPTTEDTVLYRMLPKNVIDGIENDGMMFDKGFSSTTIDIEQMELFNLNAQTGIMQIDVPKGSKAIDLSDVSLLYGEEEVLLDRNSKFKFISYDEQDVAGAKQKIIKVELIQ